MTSPGGVEVGRVSVRVVPDTSKFLSEAKKELKALAKDLKVQVAVELETSKIKEELDKVKAQADHTKAKMAVEVDGDGVVRETRRIKNIAQKLVGAIKMTVGLNVPGSVAKIKAELKVIEKVVKGYELRVPIEFVGLTKWLGILGSISAILLTFPHLIGAIGGAVNVVGGLLATLPALLAGAAFGIGALVVGMQGFFSALGQAGDAAKFEEALKNLTPSAQSAARALAEFREPLKEIKQAVQESLFKGLAEPFSDLKVLLPPIKQGLVGSAAGIREMAKAWIQMATSQKSIDDTGVIASNVSKMFAEMKPAAASFGQALRDITVVGSTFLPALGEEVSKVTAKFAAWAQSARDSGRLEQIIQNAIDKIKQFGRILVDVKQGLENIFTSMSGGKEFLDIVESATESFRAWSELKSTQQTLKSLGEVLRTVAKAAWELFQQVFKSAGEILKDFLPFLMTLVRGIGAFLAGAIRAVTPMLKDLARWFSDNRAILVPLVLTIASLVTAFKLMVTAAKAVQTLSDSIKVLKSSASIIGTFADGVGSNMGKVASAIGSTSKKWFDAAGRWIAAWADVAVEAAKQAAATARVWIVESAKAAAAATKNFVAMAASATANAIKIAAVWIAQMVRMVAATIAEFAIMLAAWIANWVRMAAVALAQAARVALAWLIAMGPIAIIAAAIIALVALIILNWDKIVAFLESVWNWIKDLAVTVWTAIADFFTGLWDSITGAIVTAWNAIGDFFVNLWDTITGAIRTAWNAIGDFFSNLWNKITTGLSDAASAVWDWAKSVPGKIWDGIKAAGQAIFDAGKWIIKGIVNGLKAAAGAVWDFIKGICDDIWQGIKDFFGIGSPSRLMMKVGRWINEGWAIGLRSNADTVSTQAGKVSEGIRQAFAGIEGLGTEWADSIVNATPAALAAVSKLVDATNDQATMEWRGQLTSDDMRPLEERLLDAMATGVTIELDGRNVTKSVNKNNLSNMRRR